MLPSHYDEVVVDRLFDRTVQLNKVLLPLMQAAEQTLGLDERTRSRTLVRIDAGGGCVDDVNWLLARGYQVIGKDYSPARAERLAQSVLWWADDPKVCGSPALDAGSSRGAGSDPAHGSPDSEPAGVLLAYVCLY